MKTLLKHLLFFTVIGVCSPTLAQDEEKPKTTKFVVPPDVNGNKTVIALPETRRPIKVGVYSGPGAPQSSVDAVVKVMKPFTEATTVILSGEEIGTLNLSAYDVLGFSWRVRFRPVEGHWRGRIEERA